MAFAGLPHNLGVQLLNLILVNRGFPADLALKHSGATFQQGTLSLMGHRWMPPETARQFGRRLLPL